MTNTAAKLTENLTTKRTLTERSTEMSIEQKQLVNDILTEQDKKALYLAERKAKQEAFRKETEAAIKVAMATMPTEAETEEDTSHLELLTCTPDYMNYDEMVAYRRKGFMGETIVTVEEQMTEYCTWHRRLLGGEHTDEFISEWMCSFNPSDIRQCRKVCSKCPVKAALEDMDCLEFDRLVSSDKGKKLNEFKRKRMAERKAAKEKQQATEAAIERDEAIANSPNVSLLIPVTNVEPDDALDIEMATVVDNPMINDDGLPQEL